MPLRRVVAAALAGVTRSPFTGVIFALELTYAIDTMLPLLVACTVAHMVTVLVLKRSILTEKVARRGFHVMREYQVDPLDVLAVREVMRTNVITLSADLPLSAISRQLSEHPAERAQRLFPVVDAQGQLAGVVTSSDVARLAELDGGGNTQHVSDVMRRNVIVAYPDETLRMVAAHMVTAGVWRMPVVTRADPRQIVGLISQRELLRARAAARGGASSRAGLPTTHSRSTWPTGADAGGHDPHRDTDARAGWASTRRRD